MVSDDEVHVVTDIVPIARVFRDDHDLQCHIVQYVWHVNPRWSLFYAKAL